MSSRPAVGAVIDAAARGATMATAISMAVARSRWTRMRGASFADPRQIELSNSWLLRNPLGMMRNYGKALYIFRTFAAHCATRRRSTSLALRGRRARSPAHTAVAERSRRETGTPVKHAGAGNAGAKWDTRSSA
jgi:hypothetical protein